MCTEDNDESIAIGLVCEKAQLGLVTRTPLIFTMGEVSLLSTIDLDGCSIP
jgi:hypothetical protein